MKKNVTKIISLLLSAVLLTGSLGASGSVPVSTQNGAPQTETAEPASAETYGNDCAQLTKDETVYVLADSCGAPGKIIVSDYIQNVLGLSAITDTGTLDDVENVKGSEAYTSDGNTRVWDMQGRDLYCRGTMEKELPVTMTVRYQLDGTDITPEELAGKSGHVTIRFDYVNNQYETADINGSPEKIYVPFAVLTGLLLDGDTFSHVKVTNGHVISDGSRTAVVGLAFPGLRSDLAFGGDDTVIPEYVEVSADTSSFSLPSTYSIATNSVFNEINPAQDGNKDGLTKQLCEISSGVKALVNGSDELYEGLSTLLTGADALSDGMGELSTGLGKLSSSSSAINSGAKQVFTTLLSAADTQLKAAGLTLPKLAISNYDTVLNGVLSSMNADAVVAAARAKVETSVRAQEADVRAAVSDAVRQEVTAAVTQAVRTQVESQILSSLGMTNEQYESGISSGSIPDTVRVNVEAAVSQQMSDAAVQTQIDAGTQVQMAGSQMNAVIQEKTEEQIQSLIDQNMASDDVQAQIKAALDQIGSGAASICALKAQLDSYRTFYQGVNSYTKGVDQAAAGAKKLNASMPELIQGITKLRDGAQELADGLSLFTQEGAEAFLDGYDGGLETLLARLTATENASRSYRSFSGLTDGMDGQVKFIYKTAAVEAPQA